MKHPGRQHTGRATTAAIQQVLNTTLDSSKPSPASGAARQQTTARSDETRENKRRLCKRVARTMTDKTLRSIEATFVQVTFVHIRNISAVTDLISQQLLTQFCKNLKVRCLGTSRTGKVKIRLMRGQGKKKALSRQG